MISKSPLVSIGLPVYNAENFIRDALNSIQNQTLDDFELIISDNASTDGTERICKEFADRDQRIRYYRNDQNMGAKWNHKRVFDLSVGRYFKWISHDDLYAPTYLARCVEVLASNSSVVLCHTQTCLIDKDGNEIPFSSEKNCLVDKYGNTHMKLDEYNLSSGSKVHQRYGEVLREIRYCHMIYGLIPSEQFKKISLQGNYYGWDKVFLAEISLLGDLEVIPEKLFFNRRHAKQSGSIPAQEKSNYTKTGINYGPITSRILCSSGYLSTIAKFDLSLTERFLCLIEFAGWLIRLENWKRLISAK
jgi:glycosyltransferase involved in cell wall biosynthesis